MRCETARKRSRLALPAARAARCESPSSPTSTRTFTPSRRCSRRLPAEAPDEIWCLGDVVGYGPEPNRCCAVVAERATVCLAGNHDLAVIGSIPVDDFNGDAAAAVRWTQERDRRRLGRLSRDAPTRRPHATAPSSSTAARSTRSGTTCSATQAAQLSFAGDRRPARPRRSQPRPARALLGRRARSLAASPVRSSRSTSRRLTWLLNPGSVGQPRGNDPRAAWLMVDFGSAASLVPPRASTRSSEPRRRSWHAACRRRSRRGLRSGVASPEKP